MRKIPKDTPKLIRCLRLRLNKAEEPYWTLKEPLRYPTVALQFSRVHKNKPTITGGSLLPQERVKSYFGRSILEESKKLLVQSIKKTSSAIS